MVPAAEKLARARQRRLRRAHRPDGGRAGSAATCARTDEDTPTTRPVRAVLGERRRHHVAVVHCETTTGCSTRSSIGEVVKLERREVHRRRDEQLRRHPDRFAAIASTTSSRPRTSASKACPDFASSWPARSTARREGAPAAELDLLRAGGLEKAGQFRFTPPTHALLAFAQALTSSRTKAASAGGRRYRANHDTCSPAWGARLRALPRRGAELHHHGVPLIRRAPVRLPHFYRASPRGFLIYPGKLTRLACFRIGNIGRLFAKDIQTVAAHGDRGGLPRHGHLRGRRVRDVALGGEIAYVRQ